MDALIAVFELAGPEVTGTLRLIRGDVVGDHFHLDGFSRGVIGVRRLFALTDGGERRRFWLCDLVVQFLFAFLSVPWSVYDGREAPPASGGLFGTFAPFRLQDGSRFPLRAGLDDFSAAIVFLVARRICFVSGIALLIWGPRDIRSRMASRRSAWVHWLT